MNSSICIETKKEGLYVNGVLFQENCTGKVVDRADIGHRDGAYYPYKLNKTCKHGYAIPGTQQVLVELHQLSPAIYLVADGGIATNPCPYC